MLVSTIILVVVSVVAFVIAIFTIIASGEKGKEGTIYWAIAFLLVGGLAITSAAGHSGIETSEGLPVGSIYIPYHDNLPPENIIQVVKAVSWEDSESLFYLMLVPYNDINGTRMLYKISWDDCETPITFNPGDRIINDNEVIKQV